MASLIVNTAAHCSIFRTRTNHDSRPVDWRLDSDHVEATRVQDKHSLSAILETNETFSLLDDLPSWGCVGEAAGDDGGVGQVLA